MGKEMDMVRRSKSVAARRDIEGTQTWIEAAPFRAHVAHVMAAGRLSQESVAAMAGVAPKVIARLLQDGPGQPVRVIREDLGRRLLEIRSPKARPGIRVGAGLRSL
jgi:hypothetical protein